MDLNLDPGEHDIKLVAPSFEEWTKHISIVPGLATTFPPVDLVPLPAAKVVNPTGKAIGKDPFVDAADIVRVNAPTESFRLGEDIQAIVFVSPLTNGIRDLSVDVVWLLERPGGQPPIQQSARKDIPAAWQQTFFHICIPASAADASGSNAPVKASLLVDDQVMETFNFRVGPGPLNAPTQCNREIPAQRPV